MTIEGEQEGRVDEAISFGAWLKRRRKALDLTQEELARQVGCAKMTIQKIEADERRPSKELAGRLAEVLELAPEERPAFVKVARAELGVQRLRAPRSQPGGGVSLPHPQPLAGLIPAR